MLMWKKNSWRGMEIKERKKTCMLSEEFIWRRNLTAVYRKGYTREKEDKMRVKKILQERRKKWRS